MPSNVEGCAKLQSALRLLLETNEYSVRPGVPPWEFAVDLQCLRESGASNSQLRWLMASGYVLAASEATRTRSGQRRFERSANLALGPRSCFVLSDKGLSFARQLFADECTDNG